MDKIVIIGANDFQNQLILKARSMGYETHVFAWECGDIGEKTADHFYPVSITEMDKIADMCRDIAPAGVTTIATDLGNITANYVARKLGLTCNSERCLEISTNKYMMRKAFRDAGISTPGFWLSDEIDFGMDFRFPLIVKPTDRSGSRAITKCSNIRELRSAIEAAENQSFEKKAIIEEYIDGDEFSFEAISYEGKHTMLAVTRKFTTGAPHFIETGHEQPSGLSEDMIEAVRKEIFKALDALEIRCGASHSEFRIDKNGRIRIIEIGSRMGGDCIGSDLVYLSTGYDFLEMVIDTAVGKVPRTVRKKKQGRASIRFIFNEDDIAELEKIKKEKPEIIYRISDIDMSNIGNITDSSSRLGYYICTEEF